MNKFFMTAFAAAFVVSNSDFAFAKPKDKAAAMSRVPASVDPSEFKTIAMAAAITFACPQIVKTGETVETVSGDNFFAGPFNQNLISYCKGDHVKAFGVFSMFSSFMQSYGCKLVVVDASGSGRRFGSKESDLAQATDPPVKELLSTLSCERR